MARQAQGSSVMTAAMIAFAALWLTSTVLLVILYTNQEEIKRDHESILARKNKAVSNSEEQSIELIKPATDRNTMVGILEGARGATAELATGNAADLPEAVRSKRDQMLETIRQEGLVEGWTRNESLSLFEALDRLYQAYKSSHTLRTQLASRNAELEQRVADLTNLNEQQKADFETRVAELTTRVEQVETERADYRRQRDEDFTSLEQRLEQQRTETSAAVTNERKAREEIEDAYQSLRDRLLTFQEKFAVAPEALSTARQADGTVLLAYPGDPTVYINRGARDRLLLGLEFAVYSAQSGIPADGEGKGRIEVVSIFDDSAECRIVDLRHGEVILEGDLIGNPIYDRTRPIGFSVIGRFDLDRDGNADTGGAQGVRDLITGWGGTVTDRIAADTDFVVLGSAPPQPKPAADLTPEQAAKNELVRQRYEQYFDDLETANRLSVPILSQDVFLQFLGYSRAAPVRVR